jgi:hypothetical protein
MPEIEVHGWSVSINGEEKVEIGVTQMPGRKRPSLYIKRGTMLTPIAIFRAPKYAVDFLDILDLIVKSNGRWTSENAGQSEEVKS